MEQSVMDKLIILADSAKYDVACTSSGSSRAGRAGMIGSAYAPGCCHTFTADGRCVSLLKVLLTNCCAFDCGYCVNRRSNDLPRAAFTPRELAELTIEFYRRNYIEGLFLSSAVLVSPDYTTELMIKALTLLRQEYRFNGYIHAKAIPGTSPELIAQLGLLADRLSVNIELPSERSLGLLCPDKARRSIFSPMRQIASASAASSRELTVYKKAAPFAPAGQSTQMIVGASPESDYQILRLTEGLYQKYSLRRVFFSAYIPVAEDTRLPALDTKPPLLREHRLYQADWLLRFYQFRADEILDEENQNFNPYLDPKCNWALHHYHLFPVDVNRAPFEMLLRVPGIGPTSAKRIRAARRQASLGLDELRRMGVVLKRAQYFITCRGFAGAHTEAGSAGRQRIVRALIDPGAFNAGCEQLSLFSAPAVQQLAAGGMAPRLAGKLVQEEAITCLAKAI
ncbi:MAG: putative DNA modification/repair radical SAM protein [Faecalibacterium sp.]|nr:putative DNA modification/repair radical SAM protein [Faecalibacterium sp.]